MSGRAVSGEFAAMKKILVIIATLAMLAGCTTAEKGAVIGGLGGAAIGGAVGDAGGAVAGGRSGGVGGYLTGKPIAGRCPARDGSGGVYIARCGAPRSRGRQAKMEAARGGRGGRSAR